MALSVVLFAFILKCVSASFYERQHREFVALNEDQISSLPNIEDEIETSPVIKYLDLEQLIFNSHFKYLNRKDAASVNNATISIFSIYKHVSGENPNPNRYQLYPYQMGTCTLIKDPYPDDPRMISLERDFPFNEKFYASMGMHLPEGDVLIKSLNCITNYHTVRPYIRFYSKNDETSVCSKPYKSDPDCYKLLKVYITTHPGLFLQIYTSNNNTRKEELFINNDYQRITKYFYISPISVINYPKIPDKSEKYYQNFDETDSKKYDLAIVNFETKRFDFDPKYIIGQALPVCLKDYPGWIMEMKIFIIGFPTYMMSTDEAKLMHEKGIWSDPHYKYISSGVFEKFEGNFGVYSLSVNEGNSGGVVSHFVVQPGHELCVNMIHSHGKYGIKVNMEFLGKLGMDSSFRFPVEKEVIEGIMEKQARRRGEPKKKEL